MKVIFFLKANENNDIIEYRFNTILISKKIINHQTSKKVKQQSMRFLKLNDL